MDRSQLDPLDAKTIAEYEAQAKQQLQWARQQFEDMVKPNADLAEIAVHPFSGSFTIAAIGYLRLSSVTPMDFGRIKLVYTGEGGGIAFGGGVFGGAGVFYVDPASLVGQERRCEPAGTPGGIILNWYDGLRPIGTFIGVGPSVFTGGGWVGGPFRQA